MTTDKLITIAVFGGFLFIFDAVLVGIIIATQRKVAQAKTWPAALGTVLFSTIEWRRSNKGSAAYPVVQYSYQVQGQGYQGRKIMPGPEVGGTGAHKVVARYPIGTQVMVYYNPQNPSEALLERDTPGFVTIFWIVLIVLDLFLCGTGVAIFLTT
jgi:hypothetical protein